MCNICTKIGKCLSPAIIYFLKTVVLFTFPEFDAFWGWLMLLFSLIYIFTCTCSHHACVTSVLILFPEKYWKIWVYSNIFWMSPNAHECILHVTHVHLQSVYCGLWYFVHNIQVSVCHVCVITLNSRRWRHCGFWRLFFSLWYNFSWRTGWNILPHFWLSVLSLISSTYI